MRLLGESGSLPDISFLAVPRGSSLFFRSRFSNPSRFSNCRRASFHPVLPVSRLRVTLAGGSRRPASLNLCPVSSQGVLQWSAALPIFWENGHKGLREAKDSAGRERTEKSAAVATGAAILVCASLRCGGLFSFLSLVHTPSSFFVRRQTSRPNFRSRVFHGFFCSPFLELSPLWLRAFPLPCVSGEEANNRASALAFSSFFLKKGSAESPNEGCVEGPGASTREQ